MSKSNATLRETRIDLAAKNRQQVAAILNQHCADLFDLYSQVKTAHWNVKGPQFMQLHLLFDETAEEILGFVDKVAERSTALGAVVDGQVKSAAKASRLDAFPTEKFEGMAILKAVADRVGVVANSAREAIDSTDELGDMVTSDLFVEITGALDQRLYFLESHLVAG